jgi:hypothetical protein
MQVFGQGGNDIICARQESNGALAAANLFSGDSNGTLTGGSGNDLLFGQAGNDILLGRAATICCSAAMANDTLTGGAGDDQMFGQGGNDRMIWIRAKAPTWSEGGVGTPPPRSTAATAPKFFTITPNGTRVRFDRTNPAPSLARHRHREPRAQHERWRRRLHRRKRPRFPDPAYRRRWRRQ